ncbi:ThiF family adenylyltransferase [Tepidamorphus sp. 3E244]|uniref:ThiF family adenylyltransferase n=1 Tax=Tepidamorphus sp. 3E244 TaxID=3385498 RepID=UPI0038FBE558
MTWWVFQNSRLVMEKAALADLEGCVDWLRVTSWQADSELAMCVTFSIAHGERELGFRMRYPSVFPDSPPMIFTEDQSRISLHQYGPDGELCLEHRPDNWHPSVTGADMVASCQRLLVEEQPGTGETVHARTAHVSSLGRDLRSKSCRLLLSEKDLHALNRLPERTKNTFSFSESKAASVYIASIEQIGPKDEPLWISDLTLPTGDGPDAGTVIRVPEAVASGVRSVDELRPLLDKAELRELLGEIIETDALTHLLIGDGRDWTLFWIFGKAAERKIINYTTVVVPRDGQRLPDQFEVLCGKKAGIVGCGSIGSKIAASLCRTGVGKFVLVDEDILFPGNVVRNELDLKCAGIHKASGLRERLRNLAPGTDVRTFRMSLGGQESAASMAGALEALGECDVLIDATASPEAFNMIASIATRRKVPMVWAEVFSGGIGGLIARARPDWDPTPLAACGQIEIWCKDQGVTWIKPENPGRYEGRSQGGVQLIADDADVSVVSAHASRYAIDILVRPEASIFPMSAYLIGLSSEWLFDQPFDTRPIDLQPDGDWGETMDVTDPKTALKIFMEHLPPKEEPDAINVAE